MFTFAMISAVVSEFWVGEVKLDLSSKISLTEKKLTCRKNTG